MTRRQRFTEDDVRDILLSPESHGALARRYGCHRSAIGYIRSGVTHRTMAPDVERWQTGLSCTSCRHWRAGTGARCDLGFPDPLDEGLSFARDCNSYSPQG